METLSYPGNNGKIIVEIYRNPIHVITVKGDLDTMVALENYQEKINQEENGQSPLHLAIIKGNNILAAKIISFGAHLGKLNKYGYAPLHLAVLYDRISLIEILINLNPESDVDIYDINGDTALHIAVSKDNANAVHALLKEGANADLPNREGDTALHLAIIQGNSEVLDVLVKYVRKPNLFDKNKFRPLHLAVLYNRIDAIRKLGKLKGTNVNMLNGKGDSAFHLATKLRNLEAIDALLDVNVNVNLKTSRGCSPMHLAVKYHHVSITQILARIDETNRYKNKPIHVAEGQNIANTLKLICRPNQNVNVNIKDGSGTPILLSVIKAECEDSVKMLLELGAKVNCAYLGMTLLHVAVCLANKNIIEMLLQYGANMHIHDNDANLPIHLAAKFCSSVGIESLIKHGEDITLRNGIRNCPLHIILSYVREDVFRTAAQTLSNLYKTIDLKRKSHVNSHEILKSTKLIIKFELWKNFQKSKLNYPDYYSAMIPMIKSYINDCFSEIRLMRSTFLYEDFDLYEFARNGWSNKTPLTPILTSEIVLDCILDVSTTKAFPIYRDVMLTNLERSVLIKKVLCLRVPVMHNRKTIYLDLEAVHKYLGNDDILNLLLAFPDADPDSGGSSTVRKRKLAVS